MHPLAEAIIAGETALTKYDKTGLWLEAPLFYRVLSLAGIARHRSSIRNIDPRLTKLMGKDWKSTMYELLVACSYLPAVQPEFLIETRLATPDFRINTVPVLYIECKSRQKYEEDVDDFVRIWRREVLGRIDEILRRYSGSFLVRVTIMTRQNIDAWRNEIPYKIESMIQKGIKEEGIKNRIHIRIDPWAEQIVVLPYPMSDREAWRFVLPFNEWDNRDCHPGILHIAANTHYLGLGKLRQPEVIQETLQPQLHALFKDYGRLWKIIIDLTCSNEWMGFQGKVYRVQATKSDSPAPKRYETPKHILLL